MATKERDYAFEALAEVTASDPAVARGPLNAALKQIRAQSEIEESYLLSADIHDRAKMYKAVWPSVALTPTALAKHWTRLPEEMRKLSRGGSNLNAGHASSLPATRRDENRKALEELKKALWPSR